MRPSITQSRRIGRRVSRRSFLTLGGAAILGLGLDSGEIARHDLRVSQVPAKLSNLPEAFHGFRLVQISDIHFEEFTEAFFLKRVVEHVNRLAPDLVVLTGDFVSIGPMPRHFAARWVYRCAAILERIQCPLRFAVLGNHDVMVNQYAVTDALKTHGIPVLTNRYVPIEHSGGRIWLGGTADVSELTPDLSRALPGRKAGSEPVILMVHEPDYADTVVGHGVSLMLSGHTHGGQVRLPLLPPIHLPRLGKKYVEGLFHFRDGMQLYVNRGIGTVGVPFRLFCPPEITVFTLKPEQLRTT